MDIMLKDCYSPADQKIFLDGLATLDNASKAKYDNGFVKLKPDEKHALLLRSTAKLPSIKTHERLRSQRPIIIL